MSRIQATQCIAETFSAGVTSAVSMVVVAQPKKEKRKPTLQELNKLMAQNQQKLNADAHANALRLTGKPLL